MHCCWLLTLYQLKELHSPEYETEVRSGGLFGICVFKIFAMTEYWNNLDLSDLFYINKNGLVCLEEWKDIPEYIGLYKISTLGRVKSLGRIRNRGKIKQEFVKEKILKQTIGSNDRLTVGLWKNKKKTTSSISIIMGEVFFNHKYCKTKQEIVDHENNNPKDNRLENLQIITHRENSFKDKINSNGFTGVHKDKNKFRAMIDFENKRYNLGSFYNPEDAHNVYLEAVRLINLKESFLHLVNPISKEPKKFFCKLSESQVLEIRTIGKNLTLKKISEIYGISKTTVSDILNYKIWKNLH